MTTRRERAKAQNAQQSNQFWYFCYLVCGLLIMLISDREYESGLSICSNGSHSISFLDWFRNLPES